MMIFAEGQPQEPSDPSTCSCVNECTCICYPWNRNVTKSVAVSAFGTMANAAGNSLSSNTA